MRRLIAAFGALALALLAFSVPAGAQTATLDSLNDSGVTADADVTLNGTELTVSITASGLAAGQPHAQHFHFEMGTDSTCPGPDMDEDGDGLVSTAEGIPAYGSVQVSLTTEGDTSPDSALAVDRFPVADDGGSVTYERTIELSEDMASNLSGQALAIVLHGIDLDDSGAYDGDAVSSLDDSLPLEATIPAACGIVTISDGGTGGAGAGQTDGGDDNGTDNGTDNGAGQGQTDNGDQDTGTAPEGGAQTGLGSLADPADGGNGWLAPMIGVGAALLAGGLLMAARRAS